MRGNRNNRFERGKNEESGCEPRGPYLRAAPQNTYRFHLRDARTHLFVDATAVELSAVVIVVAASAPAVPFTIVELALFLGSSIVVVIVVGVGTRSVTLPARYWGPFEATLSLAPGAPTVTVADIKRKRSPMVVAAPDVIMIARIACVIVIVVRLRHDDGIDKTTVFSNIFDSMGGCHYYCCDYCYSDSGVDASRSYGYSADPRLVCHDSMSSEKQLEIK